MTYDEYVKKLSRFTKNMPESMQYVNLYEYRTRNFEKINKDGLRTNYHKGIKKYDKNTVEAEGVKCFLDKIAEYKKQYREELIESIGQCEYKLFNSLLSDWVDGKASRNGLKIQALKKDVYQAILSTYTTLNPNKFFTDENVNPYKHGGLEQRSIITIMELNRKYLDKFMELADDISECEYMLFRGMNISIGLDLSTEEYREKCFFTSYSFSPSLAEQFANTGFEKQVMIKGKLNFFQDRIIATSLLHSPLKKSQLEVLVCPHWTTIKLKKDGIFDGLEEYTLTYSENYKGII
jgi:hypothetical protein